MLSNLLLFSLIAATAASAEHHARQHTNRHNEIARRASSDVAKRAPGDAKFSFYDVGLGACGVTNVESDFIVALNAEEFGDGFPGPHCFEQITISYNGKSTQATIMDRCPGCPRRGLDLSRGLFRFFASESEGIIYGDWSFGGGGGGGGEQTTEQQPTTSSPEPTTSSTSQWTPTSTWSPEPTTSSSTSSESSSTWSESSSSSTSSEISTSSSSSSSSSSSTSSSSSSTPSPSGTPGGIDYLNQAYVGIGDILLAGLQVEGDD